MMVLNYVQSTTYASALFLYQKLPKFDNLLQTFLTPHHLINDSHVALNNLYNLI